MKALLAEALGAFALVFVGCGAIMADALGGGLGTVGIALAFGGIIVAMAFALAPVSGAHLNPAVTIALVAARRFPARDAPGYVLAQVTGATLAAAALLLALGPVAGLGATTLQRGTSVAGGFLIEAVATFLLLAAILAGPRTPGNLALAAPGIVVGLDALFAGPLTMASMNPARSLGPAVVSGMGLGVLWLYLLAPVAGALAAVAVWRLFRADVAA